MYQRSWLPALWQLGYPYAGLQVLSAAAVLIPDTTFLRTLLVMVTSLTTAMSPLCEVLTVSTMAKPVCPAAHTFSMVLLSNRTRWALLTSNPFLTTIGGCTPMLRATHDKGLKR